MFRQLQRWRQAEWAAGLTEYVGIVAEVAKGHHVEPEQVVRILNRNGLTSETFQLDLLRFQHVLWLIRRRL